MQTTQVLALLHDLLGQIDLRDRYVDQWINSRDRIVPKPPVTLGLGFGVEPKSYRSVPVDDRTNVSSVDMVLKVQEIVVNVGIKAAAGWPSP
jgi:hypothetical protein